MAGDWTLQNTEFVNGEIEFLRTHMSSCVDSLINIVFLNQNEVVLHQNIKIFVHMMLTAMLRYFKSIIYNEDADTAELHNDLKLYALCKSMSPIAMRTEPIREFRGLRDAIVALGQFTRPEIDGMESEWKEYLRMCGEIEVLEDDAKWKRKMDRAVEFWRLH